MSAKLQLCLSVVQTESSSLQALKFLQNFCQHLSDLELEWIWSGRRERWLIEQQCAFSWLGIISDLLIIWENLTGMCEGSITSASKLGVPQGFLVPGGSPAELCQGSVCAEGKGGTGRAELRCQSQQLPLLSSCIRKQH